MTIRECEGITQTGRKCTQSVGVTKCPDGHYYCGKFHKMQGYAKCTNMQIYVTNEPTPTNRLLEMRRIIAQNRSTNIDKLNSIIDKTYPNEDKNEMKRQLNILFLKNTDPIQTRIIEKFIGEMDKTEKPGYVYAFTLPEDRNLRTNFKIKLGRTSRENPETRTDEWTGRLVFSKETPVNIRLESIVHKFFKYANFHKEVDKNKKEIEWFHIQGMSRMDLDRQISYITELVNDYYTY